ncbi:MAG TPA: DUF4224 domain-containing protein [Noviherbaspirillum sp.]|nr:DUF4224 domain-containing protein [Noviherbaspirillum sp.]
MSAVPYLSEEEIIEMTHYKLPKKQLEVLRRLGVQAILLKDNTVRVMRMHCFSPAPQQTKKPKLKL